MVERDLVPEEGDGLLVFFREEHLLDLFAMGVKGRRGRGGRGGRGVRESKEARSGGGKEGRWRQVTTGTERARNGSRIIGSTYRKGKSEEKKRRTSMLASP